MGPLTRAAPSLLSPAAGVLLDPSVVLSDASRQTLKVSAPPHSLAARASCCARPGAHGPLRGPPVTADNMGNCCSKCSCHPDPKPAVELLLDTLVLPEQENVVIDVLPVPVTPPKSVPERAPAPHNGIFTGKYSPHGHKLYVGPEGGVFHVAPGSGNRVGHPRSILSDPNTPTQPPRLAQPDSELSTVTPYCVFTGDYSTERDSEG